MRAAIFRTDSLILFDAHPRRRSRIRRQRENVLTAGSRGQHHAFRDAKPHRARLQICNHDDQSSDQSGWIVGSTNAGEYFALKVDKIDETVLARYLDEPGLPDVDLFIRTSGEQRTSNFMLWQSAYAEFVFLDTLWPDFDRRDLWQACLTYASRDRRFGAAGPVQAPK